VHNNAQSMLKESLSAQWSDCGATPHSHIQRLSICFGYKQFHQNGLNFTDMK